MNEPVSKQSQSNNKREFQTFEDYARTFFPVNGDRLPETTSPFKLGEIVSERVLSKLEQSLNKLRAPSDQNK